MSFHWTLMLYCTKCFVILGKRPLITWSCETYDQCHKITQFCLVRDVPIYRLVPYRLHLTLGLDTLVGSLTEGGLNIVTFSVAYSPWLFQDSHGNSLGIMHSPRKVWKLPWKMHYFLGTSHGKWKFPTVRLQIPMKVDLFLMGRVIPTRSGSISWGRKKFPWEL